MEKWPRLRPAKVYQRTRKTVKARPKHRVSRRAVAGACQLLPSCRRIVLSKNRRGAGRHDTLLLPALLTKAAACCAQPLYLLHVPSAGIMANSSHALGKSDLPARRDMTRPGRFLLWLGPLVILMLLWAWALVTVGDVRQGPRARNFGGDFALNMSSAYVLRHGENPYDGAVLLRGEQAFLVRQGISPNLGRSAGALTWGGYPPLYFWLLGPLTDLPFRTVGIVWIVGLYALMAGGFLAVLAYAGWSRRLVPCLLFLAMPQTMLQAYYGNPAGLVVPVVLGALFLQSRYPLAGGLLLSLAWLKPQLALPALVMITIFHTHDRVRFLLGLALGTFSLLAASLLTMGGHEMILWVRGLLTVSSITGEQPNMAPLVGLYAGWAPPAIRTGLEATGLAVAAVLTLGWRWKLRGVNRPSLLAVGWLWVVWFLALPYAHFPDEILLSLPIIALLGRDGENAGRPVSVAVLYLMFFSAFLFSAKPHDVQLLSLPLLVLAAMLWMAARHEVAAYVRTPLDRPTHLQHSIGNLQT